MIEIRNAIPEVLQDHVEQLITAPTFPWFYIDDVSFPQVLPGEHYKQPGFNQTCLQDGNAADEFAAFSFLMPIFRQHYIDNYKGEAVNLQPWRFRIGMNIPGEALHNNPHVDHTADLAPRIKTNVVALYYVNDDEGDTFIFNETAPSTCYTIKHRVKSERGKLLFFDGNHYHASSPAKSTKARFVISLNLYEFAW